MGDLNPFGGGGGGDTRYVTQTTNQAPWGPQAGHLENIMGAAESLYEGAPLTYFPGQTYAGFAPETEQALGMMAQRAGGVDPVLQGATDLTAQTLGGEFLGANPYLDQMYQRAADRIKADVGSQFQAAGRFGSPAHAGTMTRELGDMASQMYGQAYRDEREAQQRAAQMAPGIAQAGYMPAQQLAAVGGQREALDEARIAEEMARHQFEQAEPYERLARYGSAVSGQMGGTTTTGTPYFRNPAAAGLGGAVSGAGLAQMLGANPWLGAGLGGAIGFLG